MRAPTPLDSLVNSVRHNCHISDARHGREHSVCIYLLKMRELYRWEHGLAYEEPLPSEELSEWISEREAQWGCIEMNEYAPIRLDKEYAPYDNDAINRHLLPDNRVYSGGIGLFNKPTFFVAELLERRTVSGVEVLISGCEWARDLDAYPAMSQHATIYLRRDSLQRMLWERLEEWRWRKHHGVMERALSCYPFDSDFNGALDLMTETELETVLLHELGEIEAGRLLGPEWESMVNEPSDRHHELEQRAVRDHIADCLVTLPALLERDAVPSVHFYFANYQGLRMKTFPELYQSYQRWQEGFGVEQLSETVRSGADRWLLRGQEILREWRATA